MKSFPLAIHLGLASVALCEPARQDFTKGFEMLAALGMPALDSNAKWAKVADPYEIDHNIRDYLKGAKGNGWLVADKDGNLSRVAMGALDATPSEKKPAVEADVKADVEGIIAAISKAAEKTDEERMFSSFGYSSQEALLLLAVQLHQTGHKELAGRLADAVFTLSPSRMLMVDKAVNRIAEHQYEKAVSSFFQSGDWAAYHRELTVLAERFPRGWENLAAVRIMMPQIERQAKGESPPEPSLPGEKLDVEALAIARELTKPPEKPSGQEDLSGMPPEYRRQIMMMGGVGRRVHFGGGGSHQSLWLISKPEEDQGGPLQRLAARGMKAIPVLVALAEDPFFTFQQNPGRRGGYYSSGRESAEERALRTYQSLQRPATRGELATRMLAFTLPDPGDDIQRAEAQTVKAMAMDFWKKHRDATPEQLAAVFLKEGSNEQGNTAAAVLAASKDPEAHRLFETHILGSDSAISYLSAVRTYLQARKEGGKPFFDRYADIVRKQTDGMDKDDIPWEIREGGGVDKILKQLQFLADGETPRAVALRIAEEDDPKSATASIRSLMGTMGDLKARQQLNVLLAGAYKAKHEMVRGGFLGAVFSIRWDQRHNLVTTDDGDVVEVEDDAAAENEKKLLEVRPISEAEAKVWKRLMADSRQLEGGLANRFGFKTVAELASAALELSVSSGDFHQMMRHSAVYDRPMGELLIERAKSRLDGEPVQALPDPEKVSKERMAAIVSEAGSKPADELHKHLSTLNLDERAAWVGWLSEPGEIAMPDNIRQLRFKVVGQGDRNMYGVAADKGINIMATGFQVTPEAVDSTIAALAADVAKHSRVMVSLSQASFGPGLEVAAVRLPMRDPEQEDEQEDPYSQSYSVDQMMYDLISKLEEDEEADAFIAAEMYVSDHTRHYWSVKGGKAAPAQSGDDGEDGEGKEFRQVLKDVLNATELEHFQLSLRVLTRADFEAIQSNQEE